MLRMVASMGFVLCRDQADSLERGGQTDDCRPSRASTIRSTSCAQLKA